MTDVAQKKPSQWIVVLPVLVLVAMISLTGYNFWHQHQSQKDIEEWVKNYPVNAMVLAKHPGTYPRFLAHFQNYYDRLGKDGLEVGQLEMQQIINVNYLSDYIWAVKDPEVMKYLRAQLELVEALVNKQNDGPGLCEQYFGNSALFDQVNQTAGGNYFAKYMLASERLVLSAQDGQEYKITPNSPKYYPAKNMANAEFWRSYKSLYPDLSYTELQRAAELFDPLKSCAGYATNLRALLQMQPSLASLTWRSSLEGSKALSEAMRRLRGSD